MGVYIKGMEMPTSCHDCDMLELSGVVRCNHAYDTKNSVWGRALNCPLVEVQPTIEDRTTGRWVEDRVNIPLSDETKVCVKCSECGTHWDHRFNYCPNCGAKMEETE